MLLGFSGVGSQNAVETKAALDICMLDVKDYIDKEGYDLAVELIYEDTESDTSVAKIKVQSLIIKGVRIIIGLWTTQFNAFLQQVPPLTSFSASRPVRVEGIRRTCHSERWCATITLWWLVP